MRWWRPGDTPTGATWQPRRSVGGQGDRDSDPAVSLWWPRPPHPPPAPLASGSWERLRAGTRRGPPGPCPFLQPPPLRGGGRERAAPVHWVNWESGGYHWDHPIPIAPLGTRHLPDAGMPPGWTPIARQHLPASATPPVTPIPAAWPSPAAAVPARHRVIPSRSPLFSCLCFTSPMVPGTQSRIVAPTASLVRPGSVPGPVPPPLTPPSLPPQGTTLSPWGGQGDTRAPHHRAGAELIPPLFFFR